MNVGAVYIISAECREAVKAAGPELADRVKAAFAIAAGHWLTTDDGDRMAGALAAVHHFATPEERRRLEVEMLAIRTINAGMAGVPVDFAALEMPEKPLGILGLYHDAKEAAQR